MGGLPFEQACLLYVFAPLGTMGQCLLISPFGQSSSELVEKTQRVWTSESRNGAGSNRGFGKNQDFFFAYPEDYSREVLEWNGNKLSARVAKQAYTVIFIYVQDEGTLDLMCKGNKTRIYEIQELFAQTILGIEKLPENERDSRIYELAPLLKPNFKFRYEPSSIIQSVAISKIRLTRRYTWDVE